VILLRRARQRSERSDLKGNFNQTNDTINHYIGSAEEAFDVIGAVISLTLCAAFALAAHDTVPRMEPTTRLAQASPDTTASSITNLQGIGLTASHKQIIYDGVANEQEQTFSGDPRLMNRGRQ
jgi:hypothetical protein